MVLGVVECFQVCFRCVEIMNMFEIELRPIENEEIEGKREK